MPTNRLAINHPKTGELLHVRRTLREYTHAVVSFERREWREAELARQLAKLEGFTLEDARAELERREAAYKHARQQYQLEVTGTADENETYAYSPMYSHARRCWEVQVSHKGPNNLRAAPERREATAEERKLYAKVEEASRHATALRWPLQAAESLTRSLELMDQGKSDGLYDWNYCGRKDLAEKKARSFDPARFEVFVVETTKVS